jgi:hypothetical protein
LQIRAYTRAANNNPSEENMSQSTAQRVEEGGEEGQPASARRPEYTARVGNVEIPVWKNQGTSGEFYSASSPTIRYKDGEEWKDGSSYGVLDLLALSETAREASAKIRELSRGRARARS